MTTSSDPDSTSRVAAWPRPDTPQQRTADTVYRAMLDGDVETLLDALAPDLVGEVSDGLPDGIGGRHEGRDAMLREVWLPAARTYGVRPHPERYVECGDELVVVGRYRGVAPSTGRAIDAAFAHILRFDDGRVTQLQQITDTKRWVDATLPTSV